MIRKRPRKGPWILGQASEFIRKSFNRGKAMTPQREREGFQVEINFQGRDSRPDTKGLTPGRTGQICIFCKKKKSHLEEYFKTSKMIMTWISNHVNIFKKVSP